MENHLKFSIFVADVLDPVLHGVHVLPLPLPRVLRRQLVPDLPSNLLQIPLLLSEKLHDNSQVEEPAAR